LTLPERPVVTENARSAHFLESPLRTFFSLWVPVLFSLVAEPITGLVDTAFVARLGADSLAALGVGTMVLSSRFWIFNFLSVGSQTEVSQAMGRNEMDRGTRIASLALLLALGAGLLLILLAGLLADPVASAMGAADAVRTQAVTYIRWRAAGAPAVLMTLTGFGVLYGLQEMRTPLLIAVGVNALNIVLDSLLIFGPGPLPAFGIAGAAAASAISQWLGAAWVLHRIHRRLGYTRAIRLVDVRRLLQVGMDMFVRTGMLTLFLLMATRAATRLGPEAGAAHQAIRQVWVFTALFLDASAITAQSLIGWYVGSRRIGDARRVAAFVCLWSLMVGALLSAGMLAGRQLVSVLLVPPSARLLFFPAWTVTALSQPVCALAFVTDGIHWGTGDFRYLRNVVSLATACGLAGIVMVGNASPQGLAAIWWVTAIWICIRAAFGLLRIWPAIGKAPLKP
jgi:MATE family multidrug resistance protein